MSPRDPFFYTTIFTVATYLGIGFTFGDDADLWRQFRGRDGNAAVGSIDVDWSNPRWSTATDGVGWSTPVTDGRTIWITAAKSTAASPREKAEKLRGVQFAMIKDVAASATFFAMQIDADTGKILRRIRFDDADSPDPIHPMNSFASPTPAWVVTDDGNDRLIFHFGSYGTYACDKNGNILWQNRLVVDHSVGPGSSPIVVDDKVILVCDGIDQQYVAALSIDDGSMAWKTARPPMSSSNGEFQKAYSTPIVIDVAGRTMAVVPGAQWCVAYDPNTGEEIWRVDHGRGFSVTPTPIYAGGLVIFSTGYTAPELVAIDPGGTGDVTATHIRWRNRQSVPAKPSFVADDQNLYMVADTGILSAVDLDTGRTIARDRIGGNFSSSPLLVGDRLLIGDHDGTMITYQIGNTLKRVSQLDLDSQIMAAPITIDGDLVVRTKRSLTRYAGSASSPGTARTINP